MNTKVRKKLITAIKSKKYNKICGRLRSDQGFCLLGVVCDLYLKETKKSSWRQSFDGWYFGGCYRTTCPEVVTEWAGIDRKGELGMLFGINDKSNSWEEVLELI